MRAALAHARIRQRLSKQLATTHATERATARAEAAGLGDLRQRLPQGQLQQRCPGIPRPSRSTGQAGPIRLFSFYACGRLRAGGPRTSSSSTFNCGSNFGKHFCFYSCKRDNTHLGRRPDQAKVRFKLPGVRHAGTCKVTPGFAEALL